MPGKVTETDFLTQQPAENWRWSRLKDGSSGTMMKGNRLSLRETRGSRRMLCTKYLCPQKIQTCPRELHLQRVVVWGKVHPTVSWQRDKPRRGTTVLRPQAVLPAGPMQQERSDHGGRCLERGPNTRSLSPFVALLGCRCKEVHVGLLSSHSGLPVPSQPSRTQALLRRLCPLLHLHLPLTCTFPECISAAPRGGRCLSPALTLMGVVSSS